MKKTLVVVDCQHDFISGSLACLSASLAVDNIIEFINKENNRENIEVLYSMDWHSDKHMSFKQNGGQWPCHCIAGTDGAALSGKFNRIAFEEKKPSKENIFYKGTDDSKEEYSASYAKNEQGETLCEKCRNEVIVCGLASEYCVRETALRLKEKGKTVYILFSGVGFVNFEDHTKNIADLKTKGILFI